MEENKLPVSRMSIWESVFAIGWLPVHILILPLLLVMALPGLTSVGLTFWLYVIGTGTLSLLCIRFLRRDFDRLWERPLVILSTAVMGCLALLAVNFVVGILLSPFLPEANPNNEALLGQARDNRARIIVTALILAPILEELMFRGGVFGLLRRWSRPAAYVVCVLLFGVYHTWQYALEDPTCWLYMIQYLPAGILLCWCCEGTECIWTSIFLHMLNNGISLWMMLG